MSEVKMIDFIAGEIANERWRQDEKWGEQNHPNGTGPEEWARFRDVYRASCDQAHRAGKGTWLQILREEVYEAFAESDPELLEAELLQVAAVAVAWIEALRRSSGKTLNSNGYPNWARPAPDRIDPLLHEQDVIRRESWHDDPERNPFIGMGGESL